MFDWSRLKLIWEPRMLSILRIMAGLLLLDHGLAKVFHFPSIPSQAPHDLLSLGALAGILETVGGVLLSLGLFTRLAAFVLAGEMAVAYFMAHAPKSFFPAINGGDAAILYCFIYLYLLVAGPGIWSLDRVHDVRTMPSGRIRGQSLA